MQHLMDVTVSLSQPDELYKLGMQGLLSSMSEQVMFMLVAAICTEYHCTVRMSPVQVCPVT